MLSAFFVFALLTLSSVSGEFFTVLCLDDGSTSLQELSPSGEFSLLQSLIFPCTPDSEFSITADLEGGVFITNGTSLVKCGIQTGEILSVTELPVGGRLRHISFDYKGAADGAPGNTLYGIWETAGFNVSLVSFNDDLDLTLMTSVNVTGTVRHACMGLPKPEPQWKEPEMKHYGVILAPAGDSPPGSGKFDILVWFHLGDGGKMLGWAPLVEANGAPLAINSMAIDYDGGSEKPVLAHNVFMTQNSEKGGSDFGIVHMSGKVQVVYDHTPLSPGGRQSTQLAAVDQANAKYYTVFVDGKGLGVLLEFDCVSGKVISTTPLNYIPAALSFDLGPYLKSAGRQGLHS